MAYGNAKLIYVMISTIGLLMSCRLEAIIKSGRTSDTSGIIRVAMIPNWIGWLNRKGIRTNVYAARLPTRMQMIVTADAILIEFNIAVGKVRGTDDAA